MADIKHLLYILPDVAYAVELVPGKDGGAYAIRDYLQVNGDFMNEDELLENNLKKLVGKLQPQAYDLVLPDFLFTNTIVNVNETGSEKVKKYLESELIPSLDISSASHAIQTFVLTELKGSSRVQLSALELSVLEPLQTTFVDGPSIKNIYPLSWTLKSLISLEPSISLVQMGANLYLVQHYIGVDQAISASAEDAEKLVETIKTLKGAEPNIQTLYLLSSALVESKLKEGLKNTLPIQQLADDSEESEMPSYIKQVAEASAKTLSVADYKIPVFTMSVGKNNMSVADSATAKEVMPDKTPITTDLPAPSTADDEKVEPELEFADKTELIDDSADNESESEETSAEKTEVNEPELVKPEEVDLSQFSSKEETESNEEIESKEIESKESETKSETSKGKTAVEKANASVKEKTSEEKSSSKPKAVIKNDRGTNYMVKMIFIGLTSFFVTVGIGLGIGLGLLTFTKSEEAEPTPTAEVSPTPEPTPTPVPAPELNRADYKVKVVNATTKAGYASEIADLLEAAGFASVAAGNALGDYEAGNYVLMTEENKNLIELLSKDIDLELVYASDKEVEDAAEAYTVIVVLAE